MQTFDQSLWDLFQAGLVNYETALENASNADDFKLRMAGHCLDRGHFAAVDAVGRVWGTVGRLRTSSRTLRVLSFKSPQPLAAQRSSLIAPG